MYEKAKKKLRGSKKTEFLKKEFFRPTTQHNYVSNIKKDTPRKRALWRDLLESQRETKRARKTLFETDEYARECESELANCRNEYDTLLEKYFNSLESLEAERKMFRDEVMALQEENSSNLAGLTDFQARFEAKLEEIDNLEKKLAAKNVRNLNKTIQRKDKKIEDGKNTLLKTNAQISVLEGTVAEKESELMAAVREKDMKNERIKQLEKSLKKLNAKHHIIKGKPSKKMKCLKNVNLHQ